MREDLSLGQISALERLAAARSQYILGIDEVGYGAWAGPVTVCAVVVEKSWTHPAVKDSKALTREQRTELCYSVLLPPTILACSVKSHSNDVIDSIGLGKARDDLVAATAAECLAAYPDATIVMDGNVIPPGLPAHAICLPKADVLVKAVSAASIIAKDERDAFMLQAHEYYPGYGFKTNVGYGTPGHRRGLEQRGPCALHRMSYRNIREILANAANSKRLLARLKAWPQSQNAMPGSMRSNRR